MLQTVLLAIILLAIFLFMMSIVLIFKKNGKFPNSHIGGNEALKAKGIHCAAHEDDCMRNEKGCCKH